MSERYLFTSEAVAMGHPDKMADQIADAILDEILKEDPIARVACEVMVTGALCIVAGEITTSCYVDVPQIARNTIRDIGYEDSSTGFDYRGCEILTRIGEQSPDIKMGVDEGCGLHKEQGAGDQGMMFGYATNETPELMPMPIHLARGLVLRQAELRRNKTLPYLRPDGKSQVTVAYEDARPVRVHTVVFSTQHDESVDPRQLERDVQEQIIKAVIPEPLLDKDTRLHVNPTGRFVEGGPRADSGLTGRKVIADTYGGRARHGGGAFSGKDPSKVDRSASYYARYVAKNVVAAGLADECEIQVAYAIGLAEPVSVYVNTFGSGRLPNNQIRELVQKHFQFTPKAMIEQLNLRRPIYLQTARYGHFGIDAPDYTWERTDRVEILRREAGLLAPQRKR